MTAGSNAMRVQLMVLDRAILARRGLRGDRCGCCGGARGPVRSRVPQLFARRADRTALLAECPLDADGARAVKAAEAVAQACADVGWTHRRIPPPDDVLAAHPEWPAGYRRPRDATRPG
ncbi:hypothetical protein ACN6LM_006757 [Streptomyces sp. SAS_281]|uniref:hypothetical protein n=1 Tax=Streptomyces sp. SAS_281 TaxID=3412744 RepID=UPI00403D3BE6